MYDRNVRLVLCAYAHCISTQSSKQAGLVENEYIICLKMLYVLKY